MTIVKMMMSISVFVCLLAYAEDNKINETQGRDPLTAHMESRDVFLSSMSDPYVAELFRQDQLSKFSTPFDRAVRSYFSNNEVFAPVFDLFRQNYGIILSDFSNRMLITSTELERGLTSDYDRILKIIQETAIDLGFSKEAVKNFKIYVISGSENAFTVSGLQDQIIIVFQRDILRTMSNGEIRAVVGHELGHIRAEHVITGQVNSMMLQLLGIHMANGFGEKTSAEMHEELRRSSEYLHDDIESYGFRRSTKDLSRILGIVAKSHTGGTDSHSSSADKSFDAERKQFEEKMNGFMMAFLSQPEDFQKIIFVQYLDILIQNLKQSEVIKETIDFFSSVRDDFAKGGYFRAVNPSLAGFHLMVASLAASQAFETTSDMISNSVVKREYLASAMAKLLGADFDGSRTKNGYQNRQERSRIIQKLLKQAVAFREKNKGDTAAELLSFMSHPAPVIRVEQIMALKKYPAIIFADPFMRVLYLRDLLSMNLINVMTRFNQFEEAAEKIKNQGGKPPKRFLIAHAQAAQTAKAYMVQLKQLNSQVVEMILSETSGGITAPLKEYSDVVMVNGFLELNTRLVSGAPRFVALLKYLTNYRKELLTQVSQLQEFAKTATKEQLPILEYSMQILIQQFEASQEFVAQVLEQATERLNNNANLSAESRNLISTRLLYLEKVGTTSTAVELAETLKHVQASLQLTKKLPESLHEESLLFTEEYQPLQIIIKTKTSKKAKACQAYFVS